MVGKRIKANLRTHLIKVVFYSSSFHFMQEAKFLIKIAIPEGKGRK